MEIEAAAVQITDDGNNMLFKQECAPLCDVDNQIQESLGSRALRRKTESQEDVHTNKRSKTERKPLPSIRFDGRDHLPQIDKSRQVRCKLETCDGKKTYVFCPKCNVHLCFNVIEGRNCFTVFHKLEKENEPANE